MISDIRPLFGIEMEEALQPDIYFYDTSMGHMEPAGYYVVSRRKNGRVLSRYEDDVWDVSPYSAENTSKITFSSIKDIGIRSEAKRLVFLYFLFGAGRYDASVSGATLRHFYDMGIKLMAGYAEEKKLSIKQLLENKKAFKDYIETKITVVKTRALYLSRLLKMLETRSNVETGIEYVKYKDIDANLSKQLQKIEDENEQTEVIPVSIYISASKQRWEHIDKIESNLDAILNMVDRCLLYVEFARADGRTGSKYEKTYWRDYPNFLKWDDAVKQFGLTELFSEYNVNDRLELMRLIGKIQSTCSHLIYMNTGMRDNEGRTLEQACYIPPDEAMPPRIEGRERKVNRIPVPQVWITVEKIKKVIDILVKIGDFIAERFFPYLVDRPLIVSIGYLTNHYTKKEHYEFDDVRKDGNRQDELPLDEVGISITQKHMKDELEVIEPLRDWANHKWLKVGVPWRFNKHQYRRSLAVYALGSGLVSLFALKEQFGHLLSTMTAYYGNGNLVAKKIDGIDDRDHIANLMKTIGHELEALCFIKNVPFSEESLFGAGGVFYGKNLAAKTPEARAQVLKSLPDTIRKFKKGEMRWKETAIGGCASTVPCDKHLFPSMINYCKECESGVQKISKIEILIERQEKFVAFLSENEPDSMQHRTEVRNLNDNKEYLEWLCRKIETI